MTVLLEYVYRCDRRNSSCEALTGPSTCVLLFLVCLFVCFLVPDRTEMSRMKVNDVFAAKMVKLVKRWGEKVDTHVYAMSWLDGIYWGLAPQQKIKWAQTAADAMLKSQMWTRVEPHRIPAGHFMEQEPFQCCRSPRNELQLVTAGSCWRLHTRGSVRRFFNQVLEQDSLHLCPQGAKGKHCKNYTGLYTRTARQRLQTVFLDTGSSQQGIGNVLASNTHTFLWRRAERPW